jgi:cardiolipin synthase A/B
VIRSVALLIAAFVNGCATPPPRAPADAVAYLSALDQSCTARVPEEKLRAAVGDDEKALDFARRVSAIELARSGRPYTSGNRVTLLKDGVATHAAQMDAIRGARHHIHLDVYILRDDDIGTQYANLLVAKARAGVKVRVMYDGFGTLSTSSRYLERLGEAGVELYEFNSVNPTKDLRLWRLNHRNHRKVLIVDGRIAFTGGINISNEYSGESKLRRSARRAGREGWRDTQVRIEGPAVAHFQDVFLDVWGKGKGPLAKTPGLYPKIKPVGEELVQLLTSPGADFIDVLLPVKASNGGKGDGKDPNLKEIYVAYLAAIDQAQSRVWITQAYFAPDDAFVMALERAAARGVDVRLVMPGLSDVSTTLNLQRHYYVGLLEAGIRLYEYEPAVMHAKTMVIDGVWSTVGSSNLDYRSFIHNDEANAVILGSAFGKEMEKLFLADLQNSEEIVLEKWRDRGFVQRMKEFGAVLVKYWI